MSSWHFAFNSMVFHGFSIVFLRFPCFSREKRRVSKDFVTLSATRRPLRDPFDASLASSRSRPPSCQFFMCSATSTHRLSSSQACARSFSASQVFGKVFLLCLLMSFESSRPQSTYEFRSLKCSHFRLLKAPFHRLGLLQDDLLGAELAATRAPVPVP